jgi:hypothetical protein
MARATTPKAVEVEEETEAVEVEVAVEEEAEAPVLEVEEVEVAPATKSFTAPNTWTAFYGSKRYDFIEGKKYNLPADAYDWFSK